jgi:hypothetical protein
MANIELKIKYRGDRYGWRVEGPNGTFNPNPSVKKEDTVRWHSPDINASIIFLEDSPFRYNGHPVRNQVIELHEGDRTDKFEVSPDAVTDQQYEYAVLVRTGDRDYTYVRGAESPPGVIIG